MPSKVERKPSESIIYTYGTLFTTDRPAAFFASNFRTRSAEEVGADPAPRVHMKARKQSKSSTPAPIKTQT